MKKQLEELKRIGKNIQGYKCQNISNIDIGSWKENGNAPLNWKLKEKLEERLKEKLKLASKKQSPNAKDFF